jgi:hypothetical protein
MRLSRLSCLAQITALSASVIGNVLPANRNIDPFEHTTGPKYVFAHFMVSVLFLVVNYQFDVRCVFDRSESSRLTWKPTGRLIWNLQGAWVSMGLRLTLVSCIQPGWSYVIEPYHF